MISIICISNHGNKFDYGIVALTILIVALTGLPIGCSIIVALTGLPIGYSV